MMKHSIRTTARASHAAAGGGVAPSPALTLRLSRQVLAHLRAVAEGISVLAAARTYLVDDGRGAEGAHEAAVQSAILIAQRAQMGSRWRLLRMKPLGRPEPAGALPSPAPDAATANAAVVVPSLEAWAEAEGLTDWSIDELQALYAERFGSAVAPADPRALRKASQAERLRLSRMALLQQLEAYAVDTPALTDGVSGWFDEDLVARLQGAGFHTLGELRAAIALGGRWWGGLPAYGPKKARALAEHLQALVGVEPPPRWASARVGPELAGHLGSNRGTAPQIDARDDRGAIDTWVALRSQSPQTQRAYRREAERFLLWLLTERGRALSGANADDCKAYMGFLARVPPEWMRRGAAKRLAPGWAPFAAQPGVDSQRYALTVVSALFAWLVDVGYLVANPWRVVNIRLPDDASRPVSTSRAFTPAAWRALFAHLQALSPAASARMHWLLVFAQATGLRAAELLRARQADLQLRDDGYWLHVHGKGARNRWVPVPAVALEATRAYLQARSLHLEAVHPNTPLLAVLAMPQKPGSSDLPEPGAKPVNLPDAKELEERGYLSYPTLAAAMKRFVAAALAASSLTLEDRAAVQGASLHWLRHTHATRAAEADVPVDVLQANLGQADPRTTARYFRAQERRRREAMEAVFTLPISAITS
ncbi:tyrosine-type recombinase/integrase [Variovorax sp. ZS18.2.2]|uniref:tyrosine-type recombinase/integrase n=1 Tax=Variovorax sp. ZS18.2.2 TaxID=2971255 RepID=UPI002151E128|nr:tyrosine-type recombinase/integrase [Variovorax sp. ZS18.2.2]MCR6481069.1 tyrosine-type recombinase/integrase [Variovorax sp. ZS18.2.2]